LVLSLQNQENHAILPAMPTLTDGQRDLIERIGVLHDQIGLRPASGRILGLLLASSEPELTFDQIRETLGLSKSATSTALQHLQTTGSVEYRTHPGDRRRYFTKSYLNWEAGFVERMVKYFQIRDLLVEASEYQDEGTESHRSLQRMIDFLAHLEGTILDTYQQWLQTQEPSHERSSSGYSS
jgi:DNA-binding transcriptional regulator GbsR (MarR family)